MQKRSKSDPLQPCTTAPSPTCTAPRNERDRVPVITGRVHKGDRRTSTGTIDELLILDKRLKHLETLLDDWKEANMFATELIGTTKVKDQRVEYLRSRTTQRDIRTAITAGEHKKSKVALDTAMPYPSLITFCRKLFRTHNLMRSLVRLCVACGKKSDMQKS